MKHQNRSEKKKLKPLKNIHKINLTLPPKSLRTSTFGCPPCSQCVFLFLRARECDDAEVSVGCLGHGRGVPGQVQRPGHPNSARGGQEFLHPRQNQFPNWEIRHHVSKAGQQNPGFRLNPRQNSCLFKTLFSSLSQIFLCGFSTVC